MALCKQKRKCFIWASMYLECVNAFYVSYWRRDHHFTRSSKPRKGPATVALLLVKLTSLPPPQNNEGWRMVKSETLRDAEILFRNPSPRLFVESFETQKSKNKPCKNETYQKRLWDFRILPKFSETHFFLGSIRHPYNAYNFESERFFFGTLPLLGGGGEIKGWTQSWWRVESWVILTLYTFHCFLLLGFFLKE